MTQLTLSFPDRKNGNGTHGRRERDLAVDLGRWIADLDAAEALGREQLQLLAEQRAEVYRHAEARGVTPTMLRAARQLMRR
jgi:hypothetical protein